MTAILRAPGPPLSGHILTPQGFVAGQIVFDVQGRIERIDGSAVKSESVRDSDQPLLLPGFVDLHVHGGGGRDIMEGGDAASEVARLHARHGTTALLATTMTASPEELEYAFAGLKDVMETPLPGGARILGVHLEGPYINPGKLGAQPDCARPFDAAELDCLNAIAPIKLVTLAPEIPGSMEAIESLVAAGFRVQLGHSLATYEETVEAMQRGARGFTHLFNAMTGLRHREPGMAGAALAHGLYAELIPDLLHVHPGAIRVALRAIPGLYCVSDSTAAAGMPDGDYILGRQRVNKCHGGVRLADGTLAGSSMTLNRALLNLVNVLGLELHDASKRVSTYAADYLGVTDRGRLTPGAWGDVVTLNRDLDLVEVHVEGNAVNIAAVG